MKISHCKFGFTLMETMVSSAIAGLMLAFAIVPTYLYCQRMFDITMKETEATFAMQKIRDRLLFHAGPGLNCGLLTGVATNDGTAITVKWTKSNLSSNPDPYHPDETHDDPNKIRLVWREDTTRDAGCLFNERLPHDETNQKWQCPNSMLITKSWANTIDFPRMRFCLKSDGTFATEAWILLPK